MNKIISILLTLLLLVSHSFVCLKSQAKESIKQQKKLKTFINKELASFYPEDTLVLGYFNYTSKNIETIKSLIEKYNDNDSLNDKLFSGLDIFSNLTINLGPGLTVGMLKPQKQEKELYLAVIETKNDNFSPQALSNILASSNTSISEDYKGYIIQKSTDNQALNYTKVGKYFVISNTPIALKIAIDTHLDNNKNILSSYKAQEAASMIPKEFIISAIVNNVSLAKCSSELSNESYDNNSSTDNDQKSDSIDDKLSKIKDTKNNITKNLNLKDTHKEYIKKYYNEFIKTDIYTSCSLELNDDIINLKLYTPYSTEFLAKLNPQLKDAIDNLLKVNKKAIPAKLLPSGTVGYIMISNISSAGNLLNNIELEEFQSMYQMGKFFINAFLGIDFDNQLLPIFSGYNIVSVTNNENNQMISTYLSYNKSSLKNIDEIIEKLTSNKNEIQTSNETINKFHFMKISLLKESLDLLYGKHNKSVLIGESNSIKTTLDKLNDNNISLYNADSFNSFKKCTDKNDYLELYLDISLFKNSNNKHIKQLIPEEYSNYIKSIFVTMKKTKKKGHLINLFVKLD